jgi:hypothetical protein
MNPPMTTLVLAGPLLGVTEATAGSFWEAVAQAWRSAIRVSDMEGMRVPVLGCPQEMQHQVVEDTIDSRSGRSGIRRPRLRCSPWRRGAQQMPSVAWRS